MMSSSKPTPTITQPKPVTPTAGCQAAKYISSVHGRKMKPRQGMMNVLKARLKRAGSAMYQMISAARGPNSNSTVITQHMISLLVGLAIVKQARSFQDLAKSHRLRCIKPRPSYQTYDCKSELP